MADGFKHITVTAAEEDDEVIVAGAVEAPDVEPEPEPEPAPVAKPDSKPASKTIPKEAPGDDGYHETTLEDLEGAKMPLAQRIVIIAAIICIIGALVYYFVAMR